MEAENTKTKAIYVLLLLISAISTCIHGPSFPDLSLSFLIFLSLRYNETNISLYAFLAGILHDGFQTDKLWLSPVLFPLTFLGTQFLKSNINLKFLPIRMFFIFLITTTLLVVYMIIYAIPVLEILAKFALTLLLSIVFGIFS
ncbi:MAG: hypothetical protein ABIM42_02005 [candidate division WOR-3 bacterium]